ncbi:MAG: hypothetical protein HN576_11665 [Bacteriovoracaceae bacterium]|jgi:hypothetical protein|nr:hypothetical protein [Bacteriovoracaceae bacterium]
MSLFKFNLTLLSFLFSTTVLGEIDSLGCLKSEFTATVSHKGFPFGLTQNILKLTKKNCELTLAHEKLKFVKKKWMIDVCRAPVHIKLGSTGEIEVIKKKTSCGTDSKAKNDDFCKMLSSMEQIIQDDGLIFAKGEKEDLTSEHGKIYCTYVLLRSYLRFDKILSRTDTELGFDLENPMKKIVKEVIVEKLLPKVQVAPTKEHGIASDILGDNHNQEGALPAQDTEVPRLKEMGNF